jgi:hypothetical protein
LAVVYYCEFKLMYGDLSFLSGRSRPVISCPDEDLADVPEHIRRAKHACLIGEDVYSGNRLWQGRRDNNGVHETGEFDEYGLWYGERRFPNGDVHIGTFEQRIPGCPLWKGYKSYAQGPSDNHTLRWEEGAFHTRGSIRLWKGRKDYTDRESEHGHFSR